MWRLDYDGDLLLHFPEAKTAAMRSSGFYKLSLKRYTCQIQPGLIRFSPGLTYLDYKKIIELCRKQQPELAVSKCLTDYIADRELYIDARSRLGIELKRHDRKLKEQFQHYREIVDSNMARKLRERQMWDSFFLYSMQRSANFSVPGSGKTASVLGMYAYLRQKNIAKRLLVVCPKNAFGSWIDEFQICFSGIEALRVLNIHDSAFKNVQQRNAALQYDSGQCNLILVNYESIGNVLNSLCQIVGKNTIIVFDEVHKAKRIQGEYSKNAVKLAANAVYAVAMTGTPIPNSYLDIYNLLHILYPQEYDDFFNFRLPMLSNPSAREIQFINEKLQPFFCRTTKEQLGVPVANADILLEAQASLEENWLLHLLQMKYRKNKLALLIRILQMESDPKMLLHSLNLSDFSYLLDDSLDEDELDFADYSDEVKMLIENAPTSTKFRQCIRLVSELVNNGKPVIVWCMFVQSITLLSYTLKQLDIPCECIYGEVPLANRHTILNAFRSGQFRVLLTNPHTLAESVSLHNVCHDAVYFEYSYNLVHLLQSKDRIHRLGLREGQYTQYYFNQLIYATEGGTWSLDKAIYCRLREKEQTMLDAIDRHVLEAMPTSREDLEKIFTNL